MKWIMPFLVILVLVLGLGNQVQAHKVIVFAWAENGRVHVEGGFGGKRPARDCVVKVEDDGGSLLLQGKTDDQGRFSFETPQGDYNAIAIVLETGPGHQGRWTLKRAELLTGDLEQEKTVRYHQVLDENPSFIKIAAGILSIFGLAGIAVMFRRRKGRA